VTRHDTSNLIPILSGLRAAELELVQRRRDATRSTLPPLARQPPYQLTINELRDVVARRRLAASMSWSAESSAAIRRRPSSSSRAGDAGRG
jgi:hypothetical protein